MSAALWIALIAAVVALLCAAAALAAPKDRLPLALRGLQRLLRRDRGTGPDSPEPPVSFLRRLLALALVLLAAVLCIL